MQQTATSAPVAIIGGGIMGCATAYYLARQGIKAVVLEKSTVGAEASGLNAGGVRAQCRDRRERKLAMASVALWQNLAAELGMDVGYLQAGNLRLAMTEERLQQLRVEGEEETADGLAVQIWEQRELQRRAPYLNERFLGAKYCASDGWADPYRATLAFAWAAQRLGALILPHTEVTAINVASGTVTGVMATQNFGELTVEAPVVLHAGGPWTPTLSQQIGVEIPLRPIRLTIGATPPVDPPFQEFLSAHDLGIAARPTPGGQLYVSGFGDPDPTFDKQVTTDALADLAAIGEMVPAMSGVPFVHAWSGLLDVTPDEAPVLDRVDGLDGYFLATGFSGHGFCLGPIIGKLMAEWIEDGAPSMKLDNFHLERFSQTDNPWETQIGSSVIAGQLTR